METSDTPTWLTEIRTYWLGLLSDEALPRPEAGSELLAAPRITSAPAPPAPQVSTYAG